MRAPLWAVLSTEPVDRLAQLSPRDAEVLRCGGSYNAVVGFVPENVLGEDEIMAEPLSAETDEPVYTLRFTDYSEIVCFRGGEWDEEIEDDPYEFAARLGCELPGRSDARSDT